jgi:hypothetical protein
MNTKKPRQKNRFEPRPPKEQEDLWNPQLSFEHKVGIYARQSTQAQVIKNVQSAEMQTTDLLQVAKQLGWKDEQIILYIENKREDGTIKNASGTLRIDQREGLMALYERIERDEVKAVIVAQVDRLFRDETQIQVNTFIDVCKRHECFVITLAPDTIFDFRNPMYAKMFRFLAEAAAEYITYHVRGRLHAAKERMARSGKYAGYGSVPMGYIVDRDASSPTCRKYIVYEPHAQIVRWLFHRFMELGGNLGALCRELEAMPYVFPDFPDKSFETLRRLKRVPGGFHITRQGLLMLLTNPAYIGWWVFMGVTYSKENHEPIVDEVVFWYAYYRLANFTPDGEKIDRGKRTPRYIQRETPDTIALLKDVIRSSDGVVYAHKHSYNPDEYVIVPPTETTTARGRIHIAVEDIDRAFVDCLFAHLRETHNFDHYRVYVEAKRQEQESLMSSMTEQLRQINLTQETIIDDRLQLRQERLAATPSIKEESPLERRLKERFDKLQAQKEQLTAKLAQVNETQPDTSGMDRLADFHTELEKLIAVWEGKSLQARRAFVNTLVKDAVLDSMAPRWVRLVITWIHPDWGTEALYIFRQKRGTKTQWAEEEVAILREKYPRGDREELIRLLPSRSLLVIRNQAEELGIVREIITRKALSVPTNLSLDDWHFMQSIGTTTLETAIIKLDKPPSGSRRCICPPLYQWPGQCPRSASVGCFPTDQTNPGVPPPLYLKGA